jgi:hypothetical protein
LLLLWNARPFAFWVRLLASTFLFLTLLATLGLGEHYTADLVVALPFALGVRALCATSRPGWQRERLRAAAGGFLLTVMWILALQQKRIVTGAPAFASFALVALTVGVSLYFDRCLEASIRGASLWPPPLIEREKQLRTFLAGLASHFSNVRS